jgi:hypothetical protein
LGRFNRNLYLTEVLSAVRIKPVSKHLHIMRKVHDHALINSTNAFRTMSFGPNVYRYDEGERKRSGHLFADAKAERLIFQSLSSGELSALKSITDRGLAPLLSRVDIDIVGSPLLIPVNFTFPAQIRKVKLVVTVDCLTPEEQLLQNLRQTNRLHRESVIEVNCSLWSRLIRFFN